MGLGLKIPCLLRVTTPSGEDGESRLEEEEGKWGWKWTGLREAGLVELGELMGEEEEKRGMGWTATGPKVGTSPVQGKVVKVADGLSVEAGLVGCWCWEEWTDGLGVGAGPA